MLSGKCRKVVIIRLFLFHALVLLAGRSTPVQAQVDTEFWFVVPELSHRGNTGGTPGTLRIATLELPATVTISMPANAYHPVSNPTGFQDIVVSIPGNSTAAVDLSFLIDVAASPANNRLENKALTPSGINNFGLFITATNMITVYWEVNYDYGSDLWTLKGNNALGTLFYTPFQTVYNNRNLTPRTYSAIDIVATEDNTQVTITLPPGKAASYGSLLSSIPAGGVYVVTLNRGQTFSLFPINYSILGTDRLAGTRIQSTEPIAITVKDDAIAAGSQGQDVVGDQIVPVNIIGDNYIVPEINNPNHVYVLATQNNTNIYVYNSAGLPIGGTPYVTLNAGQQALIVIPGGSKYARITSRLNPVDPVKPFYVFQMGIENQSRGGALVPAIGCTGNTQLAFTRARADNKFYFFIITEKGNQDKFLIDGVRNDGIIDPGAFTEMAGSDGWVVWFSNSINSNILSVGQHLVQNTGGIFHLAILNGFPGAAQGRLYYGYYSDFGVLNVGATVAGTNSSVVRACYGDPVQLYAYGGTTYLWTPDTYLDDATSNMPTAINLPPGPHNYTVQVSGACGSGSVDLTILVSTPVNAFFETNVASGCSPLEVVFTDQSSGEFSWQYDLGDGTPLIRYDLDPLTVYPPPPNYPLDFDITHTYTNTTNLPIDYTVTLLVKNVSGCSDIFTKTITVFPELQSGFMVDRDDGCDPLAVTFQNTSTGNTDTWLWEFGDGGSSIQANPVHLYRNLFGPDNLVFDARLVAISPYNCRDTSSHTITVRPYIEANFAFDTVAACTPHEVRITDQSIGADFYLWDFGDGTTSTSTGPVITKVFTNLTPVPVIYTVRLRVDNEEGCFDEIQRDVTVYPDINAGFIAAPVEECSPFEVAFVNNSTGAAFYFWDFGDGGTSTEVNPVHLYDRNITGNDTVFRVMLVATSTELCRDTAYIDVLVHPYIEAAFTVDDVVGCHPFTVTINNLSFGVDQYAWDFGDGSPVSNTSASSFTYTYLNTGNTTVVYPLELVVQNSQGCTDTLVRYITVHPEITANFTASAIDGCHPLTVSFTDLSLNAATYYWDFGDGASSIVPSPVHTFTNFGTSDTTYLVSLTTTSADGECVKTVSWPIVVHGQVRADFTFPTAIDCGPFEVTFDNLSFGGLNYTWDFGDGTVISTVNPGPVTHTFVNGSFVSPQDFEVILLVENYAGCTSEKRKTVTVYPNVLAAFTAPVTEGCHPLTVSFTNTSNGALTYLWEFGDGSSSVQQDPSHTFTNTGTTDSIYTVRLVSIAPNNTCSDTFRLDITVHPYLSANFAIADGLGCTPFDVVLENSSVNAVTYYWDFGDGQDTITNDLNPFVHRFVNPGFINPQTYEIILVAENFAGCTSEKRKTVTVYPDVRAAFTAPVTEGCHPLTVSFTNTSNGALTYLWDFGDGASSIQQHPSHTFTNTGTTDSIYTVRLVSVAPNNICTDTFSLDITVHPYLYANFNITDGLGCNPFDVVLENSSVNADIYYWDFGDGLDTITNDLNPFTHRFFNPGFVTQQTYEIILVAENYAGCTSEMRRTVTVEPAILAAFTASQVQGCHPLTVDFTNLSQGAAYYHWDFGNGNTSQAVSPSHTFNNTGTTDITYRVWLHATASNHACSDSVYVDIVVHPLITANFVFDTNIQCSPSTVMFTNASVGGSIFYWDFGDGTNTVTTDMNPVSHVFTNTSYVTNGNFTVTLIAENAAGCTSQVSRNVGVYPAIQAAFNMNLNEGCHPLTVNFTNISSGGFKYTWDFGDGATSDKTSPDHIYTNFTDTPVTRLVRLIATSQVNCTSEITANVTIHPKPLARFEIDRMIDCPPFELPIANTSLNASQYTWRFGDGNIFTTNTQDTVVHTYDNLTSDIVSYQLKMTATSTFGCVDSAQQRIYVYPRAIAGFSSNTEGCSPLTVGFTNESIRGVTYIWDFGDGSSIGIKDPTNVYFNFSTQDTVFEVQLTTITKYGCTDAITDSIYVYPQPVAEFIAMPTHQIYPSATVNLTNVTNPGNWNYMWYMGDGFTTSLADPAPHTYATWGTYTISLSASSAHCRDSVSHTVRIFPGPPIAGFDTVAPGCEPLTVQFRNTSLFGSTYLWDFDDGTTSTDFEPVHTFTGFGIYNVKLTVDGQGGRDYAYHQIEVYRSPEVDFRVNPQLVMLPDQEIQLYNLSKHGVTYLWDFGDGNTSSDPNPRHLYSSTGIYTIRLDVWTENGCTDYLQMPDAVTVMGKGTIKFPNAFKPDMTGPNGGYYNISEPAKNNIFRPYWEGVEEYHLQIYTRWGELIYVSEDVMKGWDGYRDEELCKQDVYVWKSWGRYSNGKSFILAGDVTLLHDPHKKY